MSEHTPDAFNSGAWFDELETLLEGASNGDTCILTGAEGECLDGLCIPHGCGDGKVTAPEDCDGTDLGGVTCVELGYYQDAGLTDIYDAYAYRTDRDVKAFIQTQLYFSYDDFVSMMQRKAKIDGQWREIANILDHIGADKGGTDGIISG